MYFDYFFLFSSFVIIFCSAVYLFAYQERREIEESQKNFTPGVSIIVPMWNEAKTIIVTLSSLVDMKNQYNGNMEIIVIDDSSTDDSYKLVADFAKKYSFIRLFMKDGEKGKSESLNQGIRIARYELVGCVDADSYPDPSSLKHVVKDFLDPKVGGVTSKLVVNKPTKAVEWFQHIEYIYSNFILMAFDSMDAIFITRGPLSLYRKDVLEHIGGFLPAHKTPTEDMEITFRIRKAGYKIKGSKYAKVYTSVMPTWKDLFWQRMRWNRGTLINFWMHRDMFLDTKFGLFSTFIFPTATLLISMIGFIIIYALYKIGLFIGTQGVALYSIVSSGQYPDISQIPSVFIDSFFYAPYQLFLFLAILIIYLLVNGFGFIESMEKAKFKYFFYVFITPFIYNPILIFFWFSAIILQTTKYSVRWR